MGRIYDLKDEIRGMRSMMGVFLIGECLFYELEVEVEVGVEGCETGSSGQRTRVTFKDGRHGTKRSAFDSSS